METPDPHTLRVHLKTPNTLFPRTSRSRSTVIFSREVLEEDGDLKKRLIGTGPYILKEHTRKVRLVLQRNPDYFDTGRPYVDEYVILSTPDAATRLAAFRTGASDMTAVHRRVRGGGGAQDEPRHRRAGARRARWRRSGWRWRRTGRRSTTCGCAAPSRLAIDRQKQVDTVFEGHGILGWGVPYIYYQDTPPTAKDLGPWWQYRPAEAKKLLAEAGHPNGFETTLFYYEYFPQMTSQVQLVQQDLKKNLNINVKITKLDYTSYYGRYVEGKWDGMAWGFQSGPRGRASTSGRTCTCIRSPRRTSSGSTTASSTS